MTMQTDDRRAQPGVVQFLDLYLLGLSNWRWSWRSAVIVDTLTPLVGMLALAVFGREFGPSTLAYVMTGNVVLALMFGNSRKVCAHFAQLRNMGGLDYYATLPISKIALIGAISTAFLTLSIPSVATTIIAGSVLLRVPLQPSLWLIVVVPACALPLAGIGAFIAFLVRDAETASAYNLLLTLVLTGLGPVVVPPDRVHPIFNTLSYLSPARYAASALRQALLGPVTPQLAVDLAVLMATTALVLALVVRRMDWRAAE